MSWPADTPYLFQMAKNVAFEELLHFIVMVANMMLTL